MRPIRYPSARVVAAVGLAVAVAAGLVLAFTQPAAAAPGPAPSPGASPDGSDQDLDGGSFVRKALVAFFGWIVGEIGKAAAHFLDQMIKTFAGAIVLSSDITSNSSTVADLVSMCRIVADGLLLLMVLVGAVLLMGRESVQIRTGLQQLAPRFVVAGLGVNLSMPVCDLAIRTANTIAGDMLGNGINQKAAAKAISTQIKWAAATGGIDNWILEFAAIVLVVSAVVTLIGRVALTVLLVIVAPLALVCHALPQTEPIARLWWRAFGGCLLLQVAQALMILVLAKLMVTPGHTYLGIPTTGGALISSAMFLTIFWVLVRMPFWGRQMIFRGLPSGGRSLVGQLVRTVIVAKTLGLAGMGRHSAKGAVPKTAASHQHQHLHLHAGRGGWSTFRPGPSGRSGATPGPRGGPGPDSGPGPRFGRGGGPAAGPARPRPIGGRPDTGRTAGAGAGGTGGGSGGGVGDGGRDRGTADARSSVASSRGTRSSAAGSARSPRATRSAEGSRSGRGQDRQQNQQQAAGQQRGRPPAWRYINPDGTPAARPTTMPRATTARRAGPARGPGAEAASRHQAQRAATPPAARRRPPGTSTGAAAGGGAAAPAAGRAAWPMPGPHTPPGPQPAPPAAPTPPPARPRVTPADMPPRRTPPPRRPAPAPAPAPEPPENRQDGDRP